MKGFSAWLAGGGIKGGITYGATDELGYNAVENIVEVHDLHATLLHLLGIEHDRFTYRCQGRDFRLTDVSGHVVKPILVMTPVRLSPFTLGTSHAQLPIVLLFFCRGSCVCMTASAADPPGLAIAWDKNYLTIRGDFPGQEIRIHYLEAYCRPGSTDHDWRTQTVIPHTAEKLEASPDGS